jgi:O-antigen ligase
VSTRANASPVEGLRIAVLGLGLAAVCIAGTGVAQLGLFSRPSDLKYAVTIILPLLAVSVVAAREPVKTTALALLLLAPFGGLASTVAGVQVPLIAPLCVAAVVVALVARGELSRSTRNSVPIALAVVLIAVPLLSGSSPAHFAGLFATIAAVAFVTARACARPGGMTVVLGGLVATAFVQASLEFWQRRTGSALNLYGAVEQPVLGRTYFYRFGDVVRPSGALNDPISLGNLLAIALPAAVALSLRSKTAGWRIVWAAAAFWIALALVLTLSRMSWIGGAAGVCVVVALQERGRLRAMLAIACAGALLFAAGTAVDGASFGQRLSSVFAPTSQTTANHIEDQTRTQIWAATGATIAAHPIAGVGFGDLQQKLAGSYRGSRLGGHAHSTYLQVLGEGGAIGGLALLVILVGSILTVARGVRRRIPHAVALAGTLVATLTCWTTDYTVRYLAVAATFAVVFGAISALEGVPGGRDSGTT